MDLRIVAPLALMVLLLSIILVPALFYSNLVIEEGFELGLVGWEVGKDLPSDPATDDPVEGYARIETSKARSGLNSLLIVIDGRQDDGTVWIQRFIDVGDRKEVDLILEFFVYSEWESFNTIAQVVAYIGNEPPSCEESFERLGSANPSEGWNQFQLRRSLSPVNGKVWIGLGITVAWETHMSYAIDDVRVRTV